MFLGTQHLGQLTVVSEVLGRHSVPSHFSQRTFSQRYYSFEILKRNVYLLIKILKDSTHAKEQSYVIQERVCKWREY